MKSLIKYSTLISLVFLVLSCSSFYDSLKLVGVKKFEDVEIKPVLPERFSFATFKVEFEVAGKFFSGTLFIKRTGESVYKNTIINNAGLNIISFEFNNRNFSLISCIEELKNQYVIKTFEDDFRNILYLPDSTSEIELLKNEELQSIYLIKESEDMLYYFFDENQNITQLDLVCENEASVRDFFSYSEEYKIATIEIIHYNFPLNIKITVTKME